MSKKASPVFIGLFVIAALLLLVLLLITFSSNNFFSKTVKFYTFFDASLNGLDVGAPVKFKGVRVGSVEAINIIYDNDTDEAYASVLLAINVNAFKTIDGWRVAKSHDSFYAEQIARGLAAKLSLESVVTGKNFVAIDYYPQANERHFIDIDKLKYQQMPSMTTNLEEFLASVDSLVKSLSNVDVEEMGNNLNNVLIKIKQIFDNVDFQRMSKSVFEAFESISKIINGEKIKNVIDSVYLAFDKLGNAACGVIDTMHKVSNVISPESNFMKNLENSFGQLEHMLRAAREFFDYIERNPSAIFTGKPS